MKTLWSLFIVILVGALLFGGTSVVINDVLVSNPKLNTESQQLISRYDTGVGNLTQVQNLTINSQVSSNSTNQVEAFFREYAETKSNIDKFRTALGFIYRMPDLMFISIVVIDPTDTSLVIYRNVTWVAISFLVFLVIIKAVWTKKIDDEG